MSTPKKSKSKSKKKSPASPNIVWFEIPADKVERAKTFYGKLFGWKIKKFPMPMEYYLIETGGSDERPNGGLMKRQQPQQGITNYIGVPSVDQFVAKVRELGGKICMPKTAVPKMGFFAICQDTEKNVFALWERSDSAK